MSTGSFIRKAGDAVDPTLQGRLLTGWEKIIRILIIILQLIFGLSFVILFSFNLNTYLVNSQK